MLTKREARKDRQESEKIENSDSNRYQTVAKYQKVAFFLLAPPARDLSGSSRFYRNTDPVIYFFNDLSALT